MSVDQKTEATKSEDTPTPAQPPPAEEDAPTVTDPSVDQSSEKPLHVSSSGGKFITDSFNPNTTDIEHVLTLHSFIESYP